MFQEKMRRELSFSGSGGEGAVLACSVEGLSGPLEMRRRLVGGGLTGLSSGGSGRVRVDMCHGLVDVIRAMGN